MIAAFFAPETECILDHLIRDFFISFAQNDVDRRLAADKLRERRHHDRIAELGAHLRGFFQHFLQLFLFAHQLELMAQVRNHTARHLMAVPGLIEFARGAHRQALALGNPREVLAHRRQRVEIHQWLIS